MKKGARVVNVARGGVIDEDALVRALDVGAGPELFVGMLRYDASDVTIVPATASGEPPRKRDTESLCAGRGVSIEARGSLVDIVPSIRNGFGSASSNHGVTACKPPRPWPRPRSIAF
jgi:hypothetical protein